MKTLIWWIPVLAVMGSLLGGLFVFFVVGNKDIGALLIFVSVTTVPIVWSLTSVTKKYDPPQNIFLKVFHTGMAYYVLFTGWWLVVQGGAALVFALEAQENCYRVSAAVGAILVLLNGGFGVPAAMGVKYNFFKIPPSIPI